MTVELIGEQQDTAPAAAVRRRGWVARLLDRCRAAILPAPAVIDETERIRRFEETRAVLEAAREVVAQEWVQGAWYVVRDRRGRPQPVGPLRLGWLDHSDVAGACLVGAVVHATWERRAMGAGVDSSPAIDLLWDTLQERSGRPVPLGTPRSEARLSRVRDLTRWNDAVGRSQADVLELLDVAASRAILEAVR
jgi:hypothetical protein